MAILSRVKRADVVNVEVCQLNFVQVVRLLSDWSDWSRKSIKNLQKMIRVMDVKGLGGKCVKSEMKPTTTCLQELLTSYILSICKSGTNDLPLKA